MKGFKGFNYSLIDKKLYCNPNGIKTKFYPINKKVFQLGKIVCCKNGLHFCPKLSDVFYFYSISKNTFYAEIEADGMIDHNSTKSCSSQLTIKKLLLTSSILKKRKFKLVESGKKRIYFTSSFNRIKSVGKNNQFNVLFNSPELIEKYEKIYNLRKFEKIRVTVNYEVYNYKLTNYLVII